MNDNTRVTLDINVPGVDLYTEWHNPKNPFFRKNAVDSILARLDDVRKGHGLAIRTHEDQWVAIPHERIQGAVTFTIREVTE